MKKLQTLIALLLCAMILCACGGDGGTENPSTQPTASTSAEIAYSVTIVDPMGKPVTEGIIVNFMNGSELVAMQMPNAQGIAEKVLPRGNYTIELGFTDPGANYHFDTEDLSVTAEKPSTQLVLANAPVVDEKTYSTYDPDTGEETSYTEYLYYAGTGYTYFPMTAGERNYIYFTPERSGLYRFSVVGAEAVLGYYGSPYFIQSMSLAEPADDGSFTINVTNGMIGTGNTGTAILVLGVDAGDLSECIISIERISDPELTVEDYPWEIYQATAVLEAFSLPAGTNLTDFDLTASEYTLVLNETDGYYHLNSADGPLVYAKLGASTDYLNSIKAVLEASAISRYYYDENGEFLKKVSFTECLLEYISYMDAASGLYPLTEDLAFIFQERGDYVGWWDPDSASYLFVDSNGIAIPGINPDVAWLFLCCYADDNGQQGGSTEQTVGTAANAGSPIVLGGSEALEFTAEVEPGTYVYYDLYKISGTNLIIRDASAYVIMGDTVYWPVDGVITVPLYSEGPSVPISLAIGNSGSTKASFAVTCVYPEGSMANPSTLTLGSFTTQLEAGNDTGYFYNYTAEAAGTLTIHIDNVTDNTPCGIVLYNLTSYAYRTMEADGVDNSLSIEVAAGDIVQITISTLPDSSYHYPAAIVEATASVQQKQNQGIK